MDDAVEDAAREAQAHPALRALTRAGYAANGLVHLLIGAICLVLASGAQGEADQTGAMKAIAGAPLGFAVLWVIAISLWALALWNVAEALTERGPTTERWRARLADVGRAVAYAAVGGIAVSVALGARPDSEESADAASRGILSLPFGGALLGAIGIAIGAAGVVFIVRGVRRGFRDGLRRPAGAMGRVVDVLGVFGYVAKGIAFAIIGIILVVAAVTADADAAGGLDAAVTTLVGLPAGPVLAVLVGAGLIAYGVFCFLRARYARL